MHKELVRSDTYLGYGYWVVKLGYDTPKEELVFDRLVSDEWYCGYIALPKGHEYYGLTITDYWFLDVHGSITYSEPSTTSTDWIIGFDGHHFGDDPTHQDGGYMAKQCRNVIDQLYKVTGGKYDTQNNS